MSDLPLYLWLLTYASVAGIVATTCVVLYRGAVRAGLSRRRRALLTTAAGVLLGGWFAVSTIFAAGGGYEARIGHQVPWMPIAVVAFLGLLLLLTLTRAPLVRQALSSPGMTSSIIYPHAFRVAGGAAFLIAMALGYLPALFALPAGLGDIAIGIEAPFVARAISRGTGHRAMLWFTWLGIADLIVALTLGGLTGFQLIPVSPSGQAISELPLVLIPVVGVPIVLALHISSLVAATRTSPKIAIESSAATKIRIR